MNRKLLAILAVGIVLLTSCVAPPPVAAPPAADVAAPAEAPKASGTVTVYASPQEEWVKAAMTQFTKDTGIKVDYVAMGSGEAFTRISAEKAAPKADVWWGGTIDPHIQAVADGLIEKYCSPNAQAIPAQYRDPDCYWTGMYVGFIGFTVNPGLLEQKNLPIPKTWADLIKPEYKGLIAMSDPAQSGTAYVIMATLVQEMGEDPAFEYLAALHKNISQYTKSGPGPITLVGQGEALIGINFVHDTIMYMKQGQPINYVIPEDFDGYEIGGLTLIKGGPNPEAGKALIDWTLTAKAQELAATANSFQVPTNPEATVSEESVKISDVKAIDYNLVWAAENRKRLVTRWTNEIGPLPR
ncbi:MAG: putative 2-aminoethylphosphonate-binding periplasmic protein precursor [Chloroflexi bacterium ADurb.Bin325]|nr:MAG: putative 2-aminoethylphosphonate-binding periplasmic protein precursor [Chloroflexi bacterium ADurb.Bin325]